MHNRKSVNRKTVLTSLAVVLIAVLCVGLFAVGFFGYTTRYGEYQKTVVNSPYTMVYDIDMGWAIEFVYKPSEAVAAELTDEKMDEAKEVIARRLEYVGAANYSIAVDYLNKSMQIRLPDAEWARSAWFYQNLCDAGLIYVGSGSEDTESYVFTNKNVRSIKVELTSAYGSIYSYDITLTLDSEGRNALRMATESIVEGYERTNTSTDLTMWASGEWFLDRLEETEESSVKLVGKTITNKPLSSSITFNTAFSLDSETVSAISMLMSSGPMSFSMGFELVTNPVTMEMGQNPITTMAIALLCAFAAIYIFFIIRYGLIGAAGLLGALGAGGVTMFILSGGFGGRSVPVTIATFAAFVFSLLLGLESMLRSGHTIKSALAAGAPKRAIAVGFRSTVWPTIRIYLVTVALAVIAILCNTKGPLVWLLRMLGLPFAGLSQIYYVGLVLVTGLLAGLAFSYFLSYLFMWMFASLAEKPRLFGGKKL